jgi:hypothetical protein
LDIAWRKREGISAVKETVGCGVNDAVGRVEVQMLERVCTQRDHRLLGCVNNVVKNRPYGS